MSTPPGDEQGWLPYAFGFVQTSVLGLVGYVSKLLRDLRRDVNDVKKDVNEVKTNVAKHEVEIRLRGEEQSRRLSDLEHKQK